MEEDKIIIPYDIKQIQKNVFYKILIVLKTEVKRFLRRIIDIIISLIGGILLIPLTIIIFCQNLKNGDNGKIFYVQERIGKNGKIFKMYKFRTMVKNADEILNDMLKDENVRKEYETYRKFKDDPRLTSFGKFLRTTGLDEFPQFINILKGEMTLVGPRPYLPEEKERMGAYYKYIIQYKPGITGVYQISAMDNLKFSDRLDMDYRYHCIKNLKINIKIAIITLLITLRRRKTYEIGDKALDTVQYITRGITLFIKRMVDILGSIIGIILLIPLTCVVWVINKINKEDGPLFYSQERIGRNGKSFKMYKFRSMVVGADEILEKILKEDEELKKEFEETRKIREDPRITKIGSFLRKTSLDEFPQFVNILKGEMSLVGPRAVVDGEIELFKECKKEVLSVKPGLTGFWASHGRSDTSYEERVQMETYYVRNMSVFLDIKILLRTVWTVFKKEGAI